MQQDISAVAALAGAATTVIVLRLGAPRAVTMVLGFVVCFLVRLVSHWQGWNLPRIGS